MCRTSNNAPAAFDGLCIVSLPLLDSLNAPYKLAATEVCAAPTPLPNIVNPTDKKTVRTHFELIPTSDSENVRV
jgi:hypothetical protein